MKMVKNNIQFFQEFLWLMVDETMYKHRITHDTEL